MYPCAYSPSAIPADFFVGSRYECSRSSCSFSGEGRKRGQAKSRGCRRSAARRRGRRQQRKRDSAQAMEAGGARPHDRCRRCRAQGAWRCSCVRVFVLMRGLLVFSACRCFVSLCIPRIIPSSVSFSIRMLPLLPVRFPHVSVSLPAWRSICLLLVAFFAAASSSYLSWPSSPNCVPLIRPEPLSLFLSHFAADNSVHFFKNCSTTSVGHQLPTNLRKMCSRGVICRHTLTLLHRSNMCSCLSTSACSLLNLSLFVCIYGRLPVCLTVCRGPTANVFRPPSPAAPRASPGRVRPQRQEEARQAGEGNRG